MNRTSNGVRKGRFLWMNTEDQDRYLSELTNRIASDFYFSDQVMSKIVDDLAPVFCDSADAE